MRSFKAVAVVVVCLATALGVGRGASVEAKPTWDRKGLTKLATEFFAKRPPTKFTNWDRKTRQDFMKRAREMGALPEGKFREAVDTCWKVIRKAAPKWKEAFDTPYGPGSAHWLKSGSGGPKKGFALGLHGGGVGAGSKSAAKSNWPGLPGCLTFYPQGIRLIHDTWNSVHGERFLLTLIEHAKARYDVDPDRVYTMGFSMGGSGSWFLAGRHPDLLAGAIPAHGVCIAEKVKEKDPANVGKMQHGFIPNVRNLAMYFYTGSEDVNCEPGTFLRANQMIDALRKEDPEGYKHIQFELHEGLAHSFPAGEPGKGQKWIVQHVRNTFPETLRWEYAEDMWPPTDSEDKVDRLWKRWFYWLFCSYPSDRMQVRASRKTTAYGNEIDLEIEGEDWQSFIVYLNPEMIDVTKETIVRVGGEEVYRGKPEPTYEALLESLDARLDRRMVFDRRIVLDPEER